jgi:hypothetical protein
MKSYDYRAVTYNSSVYCKECMLVASVMAVVDLGNLDELLEKLFGDEVHPIFANSEWDYTPTCEVCGTEHDYVTVLADEAHD